MWHTRVNPFFGWFSHAKKHHSHATLGVNRILEWPQKLMGNQVNKWILRTAGHPSNRIRRKDWSQFKGEVWASAILLLYILHVTCWCFPLANTQHKLRRTQRHKGHCPVLSRVGKQTPDPYCSLSSPHRTSSRAWRGQRNSNSHLIFPENPQGGGKTTTEEMVFVQGKGSSPEFKSFFCSVEQFWLLAD